MACTYKVRCTPAIAAEMARYEGGEVVQRADPRCREMFAGSDLEEFYTTYLFMITTPHYREPNRARWASFGIYEFEII